MSRKTAKLAIDEKRIKTKIKGKMNLYTIFIFCNGLRILATPLKDLT
jgi:hypothetical protein